MTLALQKPPQSLRSKGKRVLQHAAAWAVFIFYEYVMLYFLSGQWTNLAGDLLYYILHIGLFYLHAFIVLPYAFKRTKGPYLVCLLLLLAEMAIYLFIKYGLDYFAGSYRLPFHDAVKVSRYLWLNGWRGLYFVGFSTVFWLVRRIFRLREAVAEARYAFLQQQISPHFLFNSLNFIYNSVYKLSPAASECVMQLSDMMRYSLRITDTTGKTELKEEVEQIRNFVTISALRYDFPLAIELQIPEIAEGIKIIPLVLLTLTENVFKHGHLKNELQPAKISLTVDHDNRLTFTTRNLKKRQAPGKRLENIGIQNTIRRLEYAYPGRYTLDISEDAQTYQLTLYLHL